MDLDCLLFICILMKLSGAQDVTSVREISVQRGQSVIIPCLYKQKYALSVKYFSAGYTGRLSHDIASSKQRYHHKTALISDDTSRNIFTVHIDDVQESGYYRCAVQTHSGSESESDPRADFLLSITEGYPRLSVSRQHMSGPENGTVTVTCYHRRHSAVKWCKFAGHCMTGSFGSLDGASVEIRYDLEYMTVIMSGLKMENTGWYWCSTDELQMPVHITVHHNQTDPTAHKRTAFVFVLPVVLEILLIIIIYSALKLLTLCKETDFKLSLFSPQEESQYVMMNGKPSTHGSVSEAAYEVMADLGTNAEPHRESDYVNIKEM